MNNLVVRINEEEFNSSGYTILKGDLGDGCLWLSDIIDPCFRKLGLNRNHMGLCFLRIKSSWLYKHCRCWYPGYTIYNVKIEALNDYRESDFEFEYYRDERDTVKKMTATEERVKVKKMNGFEAAQYYLDEFAGLDSWAKFYGESIAKVNVNKPVKDKPLKPEKIIFNGPATIAIWPDGTKTVVKCQENDIYDAEKAIALVYLKKLYGTNKSKSNYLDNLIKDVEIVDQKAKSIDTDSYTLEDAKKRLYSASDDILESLGILGR